jgi:signal transduction histidine kinase
LGTSLAGADLLDQLHRSVERVNALVAAVKAYSYRDQAPLQIVDVNAGLDDTLAVLGPRLAGLTITRHYASGLPPITARGAQLNQVWTHLIENAADALGGQGEIQIITRPENEYVMVEVADDGPGITPEHQARLFEPFFTTKSNGPAGGLGLTTVYRIVRQHRGIIEAHSLPGNTRFIVRLPVDLDTTSD